MIIQKQYKFYAAHRNALLNDKCRNLHGHRYGITIEFQVERSGHISTLFADFDEKVEPHLRDLYDHSTLIDENDPLLAFLRMYEEATDDRLKLNIFPFPTTVENLAFKLFSEITEFGFTIHALKVRETDTSEIVYSREDWISDLRRVTELDQPRTKAEMV